MTKNKIYIAGKVTGLSRGQVEFYFNTAEEKLKTVFDEVVNPTKLITNPNEDWNTAMRQCIIALCDCSHIYMLKNYADSKGACLELDISTKLNIKIILDL